MASTINHVSCPKCRKHAVVTSESPIGRDSIMFLSCGHVTRKDVLEQLEAESMADYLAMARMVSEGCMMRVSATPSTPTVAAEPSITPTHDEWTIGDYSLFHYQRTGVRFVEDAGFNAIVGDEMGLGKTPQALTVLRRNWEQLTPCIICPPSGLVYNWCREYFTWMFGTPTPDLTDPKVIERFPIIHTDGQLPLMPGFKVYIVGHDIIRKPKVLNSLKALNAKFFIGDECHKFKNQNSQRTDAVLDVTKSIPHKVLLSGTPLKSNLTEYFTALHMVAPHHWRDMSSLLSFAEFGPKNKVLGLRSYKTKEFFQRTSDYIIRRKRADVYKDLPPVIKSKVIVNVSTDKKFVGMYNDILTEIEAAMERMRGDAQNATSILPLMTKLRHLVGVMKVAAAADFIEEFTLNYERDMKLAIGVHHRDVGEYFTRISKEVYGIDATTISGADNAVEKQHKEIDFRTNDARRFAVLSIAACGEGRNLQFCPHALVVERMWTPAEEEQFELRFSRPLKCPKCDVLFTKTGKDEYLCPTCGRTHQQSSVNITYLIAKGTIDEFFDDLVEQKRMVKDQCLDRSWALTNDGSAIMALAMKAVMSRLKFVGI